MMHSVKSILSSKPISIFASGCSVLDISIDSLHAIKKRTHICTVNYPLTLIDKDIVSDIHVLNDRKTYNYAVEEKIDETSYIMSRDDIHRITKDNDLCVYFPFDSRKLYGNNSFLWALQIFLYSCENDIHIYGLDFCVPKESKYARWYDIYIENERFEKNMYISKRLLCDRTSSKSSFKDQFEDFFMNNKQYIPRVNFFGKYQKFPFA